MVHIFRNYIYGHPLFEAMLWPLVVAIFGLTLFALAALFKNAGWYERMDRHDL